MTSTQLTGGGPQVVAQALLSSSTTQLHNLGELVQANDGRTFRYALAGATALVAGTLQQASAQVTADQNLTAVAAAVGDLALASTTTVTWTANQYANGYAIITVTPGVGYQYKIAGHGAYTAAAPTVTLSDAIQVALTTTSRIDIIKNNFDSVVINPTTATSNALGVAVFPVPIASYGWLQVLGVATVLAQATVTTGTQLVGSTTTAGAVTAATIAYTNEIVGYAVSGIATTEYGAVRLIIG